MDSGSAILEQERIAFHESGHCCIQHYFRHPVEEVVVGEGDGHCKLPRQWKKQFDQEQIDRLMGRDVLFGLLVAACAGKATMDRFHGRKAKDDKNWRASEDYRQAFGYALRLSDDDKEAAALLVKWGERMADTLIEAKWVSVHRLAFALLEHDQLNGAQVGEIILGNRKTPR